MPRSIAIFLTTAMLSAVTDLSGAEFLVIGSDMTATIVSDDGRVTVGHTRTDEPEALMWSRETGVRLLGALPEHLESEATDVSADGTVVVGGSGDNFFNGGEPFIWTENHGMVGLGHLPGFTQGSAVSISEDRSTVVGYLRNPHPSRDAQAFRWTEQEGMIGMTPPGMTHAYANDVSADGRVIIGHATTDPFDGIWNGFIWDEASGFQDFGPNPPGFESLNPWLVSADGSVVYGKEYPTWASVGKPFRWTAEEGAQPLSGMPASVEIGAFKDLTPDGSVVIGWMRLAEGVFPETIRAFVWDELHGIRNLRDVLISEHGFTEQELPTLYDTNGISADAMTIVGSSSYNENRGAWAVYLDKPLVSPRGDFDGDHYRTATDIDLLSDAVVTGNPDAVFDINRDEMTDEADRVYWVHELAKTYFGDANLDGEFNSSDFTRVFLAGEYEDAIDDNSGWAEGDWNGDADFTSSDMITAFLDGGYEQGPRGAVRAVPEPSTGWMVLMGALFLVIPELCERRPVRA